jgi:hypothetical protein
MNPLLDYPVANPISVHCKLHVATLQTMIFHQKSGKPPLQVQSVVLPNHPPPQHNNTIIHILTAQLREQTNNANQCVNECEDSLYLPQLTILHFHAQVFKT